MSDSLSVRRLAENEVVFRSYNENMQKGLGDLAQVAKEDSQEHLMLDPDAPLHFYCECSDENCDQRILLTSREYASIHAKRNRFIVIPNHEVKSIEHIVQSFDSYSVIEKQIPLPAHATKLHRTSVNNV